MNPLYRIGWLGFIVLSACTSVSNLDAVLKQPVADAKSAVDIVAISEQDSMRLSALGVVVIKGDSSLASRVCTPATGPDVAGRNLGTFVDALGAIDKVAAKPADASYAAILGRIKDDEKAATKDYEEERKAAIKKRDAGQDRCTDLFTADSASSTHAYMPSTEESQSSVSAALATVAALDKLANSILTAYEQRKRDLAIKATVKELVPQMKAAVTSLKSPLTGGFGLQITGYPESSAAAKMNSTALGAAVSIHRWWLAKTIQAAWDSLSRCRGTTPTMSCLDSEKDQHIVNEMSAAILQYRSLALVDTAKVLSGLDKAIDATEKASTAKGMTALLDSLSQIGNALSTISSNYAAFQKARG